MVSKVAQAARRGRGANPPKRSASGGAYAPRGYWRRRTSQPPRVSHESNRHSHASRAGSRATGSRPLRACARRSYMPFGRAGARDAPEVDSRRESPLPRLPAPPGRTARCRRESASSRRRRRSRRSGRAARRKPSSRSAGTRKSRRAWKASRRRSTISALTGSKACERRKLRRRGGRNVEVLRKLFKITDVAPGRDDPAEPPTGHRKILREARYHERVVGELEHAARRVVVGESEVDLVDDQRASTPRDGRRRCAASRRAPRWSRSGWTAMRPALRACVPPVTLDELRGELVSRVGPDRDRDRLALEDPHEMAVARIAGVRKQDLVVAVDEERHHEQQRCRRTGGDDDALRRNIDTVMVGVVAGDRVAKCRQPERRRVVQPAVGDGAPCRVDDRLRRRKIGFADLHVDDAAPRGFHRARGGLHFHDVERLDLADAPREATFGIHRKSSARSGMESAIVTPSWFGPAPRFSSPCRLCDGIAVVLGLTAPCRRVSTSATRRRRGHVPGRTPALRDRNSAISIAIPRTSRSCRFASPRVGPRTSRRAAGDGGDRALNRNGHERQGNLPSANSSMPGIGEGEVVARVGRPDMSTGAGRKTVRWTYFPRPRILPPSRR